MVDLPDSPAPDARLALVEQSLLDVVLTEQQHLDLIPLHHLVALQLILNLVVSGLAILLLCAHTTTHFDGVLLFWTPSIIIV